MSLPSLSTTLHSVVSLSVSHSPKHTLTTISSTNQDFLHTHSTHSPRSSGSFSCLDHFVPIAEYASFLYPLPSLSLSPTPTKISLYHKSDHILLLQTHSNSLKNSLLSENDSTLASYPSNYSIHFHIPSTPIINTQHIKLQFSTNSSYFLLSSILSVVQKSSYSDSLSNDCVLTLVPPTTSLLLSILIIHSISSTRTSSNTYSRCSCSF